MHTPGPWHAVLRPDGDVNIYATTIDVALCIRKRDANLVAAAPELLEVLDKCAKYMRLKMLVGAGEETETLYRAVESVLRKAKGEEV